MQVRIVLPGEPDPAMHLNVQFGVAHVGAEGQRRGGRGGEPELLLILLRGPRGIPHRRHRGLGGHQHVGAVVLDRLEGGDGAAELLAHLGVLDGGIHAVRRPADRLGGEQGAGAGQCGRPRTRQVRRRRRRQGGPARSAACGRGCPGTSTDDTVGAAFHHDTSSPAVTQQHVGQSGAEHHPGVTGGRTAGDGDVTAETDCAGASSVDQAGQQPGLLLVGADRVRAPRTPPPSARTDPVPPPGPVRR